MTDRSETASVEPSAEGQPTAKRIRAPSLASSLGMLLGVMLAVGLPIWGFVARNTTSANESARYYQRAAEILAACGDYDEHQQFYASLLNTHHQPVFKASHRREGTSGRKRLVFDSKRYWFNLPNSMIRDATDRGFVEQGLEIRTVFTRATNNQGGLTTRVGELTRSVDEGRVLALAVRFAEVASDFGSISQGTIEDRVRVHHSEVFRALRYDINGKPVPFDQREYFYRVYLKVAEDFRDEGKEDAAQTLEDVANMLRSMD